jgi:hypothetical protein
MERRLDTWKARFTVRRMNKSLEPGQTQPSRPRQTSKWIPTWGIVALIATILSRSWLSRHGDADATLKAVVALFPIIFWFIWAGSTARRISLLDEMQRLMVYEAWFFAGIATMFVLMALKQAELAAVSLPDRLNRGLDYQGAFLLMCFLVLGGFVRSKRRFQ